MSKQIEYKEDERSFDFVLRKSKHYFFSVKYNSGLGSTSSVGECPSPEDVLMYQLINLELNRYANTKPIKARFHGKTFRYYPCLEALLKIYARSEGVPIEFEYLPSARRT
jgi:hypothetical protein